VTIPPINDRLLSVDPLSLEPSRSGLETQEPAIDDSSSPGSAGVLHDIGATETADQTRSSEIDDQELLGRDVWMSAPRTFDISIDSTEITQSTPSSEELDHIATRVLSFLT
jgi:hypothetical protein